MKKLALSGIIFFVGMLFTSVAALGNPSGPPEGLNVNIVNSIPLPFIGEATINNTEENPIPVQIIDEEMFSLYQGMMEIVQDPGDSEPRITALSPPPETGKILIIEYISVNCSVDKDATKFTPLIKTTFQGTEFTHYLTRDLVDQLAEHGSRSHTYVTNQKTMIFADTDYPIEPSFLKTYTGYNPSVWCYNFVISGHLKNP